MALDTKKLVESLVNNGFSHLCVVPCSFAKYVINEAINNDNIEYVPAASEAVACSVAAGLKMSGAKPIVIVQSSGLTNMGSCITSLLKPYGITFPILTSWRTYNEGDSEIQHQHLATELPTLIEAYGYQHSIFDNQNLDTALFQIEKYDQSQTIGIITKDSFTKVELEKKHRLDVTQYPFRSEFLTLLNEKFKAKETVFIGTTGNTAREMYSFMPDTNNFYMAGNMGGALSVGLGAALAGKAVIVCGGDAEFVMHMGSLTTSGRYKHVNLTYILFDNEQNKSTGGQNTYQKHVNYIATAQSSGFFVEEKIISNLADFSRSLIFDESNNGLRFVHVKCDLDAETPRPPAEIIKSIDGFNNEK